MEAQSEHGTRCTCVFTRLGANLHAQSALINKISASELGRKLAKSALLVGCNVSPPVRAVCWSGCAVRWCSISSFTPPVHEVPYSLDTPLHSDSGNVSSTFPRSAETGLPDGQPF